MREIVIFAYLATRQLPWSFSWWLPLCTSEADLPSRLSQSETTIHPRELYTIKLDSRLPKTGQESALSTEQSFQLGHLPITAIDGADAAHSNLQIVSVNLVVSYYSTAEYFGPQAVTVLM